MERETGRSDVQHLIGEVAARHGILLKPDDAAFALVTINQLVLEEVMTGLLRKVEHAMAEFDGAAVRVQAQAGSLLASEVRDAAAAIRRELQGDVATAGKQASQLVMEVHRAHSRSAVEKWLALGVACALLMFGAGVVVGRLF
jgi:hypothetical protein